MIRSSRRLAAAMAVSSLLVAGCGGADAPAADEVALDPAAVLAAAVDTSSAADSARIRFSAITSTPQGDLDMTGEGVAAGEDMSMTMTMSGMAAEAFGGEDVELEIRATGGMMYMRFPAFAELLGVDAEWLSMSLDEAVPGFEDLMSQADTMDLDDSLAALRDLADVTEVGVEEVNGVSATHYTGTMDLAEALANSGVDDATATSLGIDLTGTVPLDVWIDEDGLVRRYVQTIESDQMSVAITMDVLEYGVEVDVEAPPAADVFDLAQLGG